MKNTITFDQFYKANKDRRFTLARRFGYTNPDDLMLFLKKHKSLTLGEVVKSYTDYKKLPRTVQLNIAIKNGYTTISGYMTKLRNMIGGTTGTVTTDNNTVSATNTNPNKSTKILNVFILDESTSMLGTKSDSMLKGVKEFVNDLKQHQKNTPNVEYSMGIVRFSSFVDEVVIRNLNKVIFSSNIRGGMTALHDAVGKVLDYLIDNTNYKEHQKVVQIFTDGQENASENYSASQIARLIKTAEAQNITVTFMGTKYDVKSVNNMYALREGNSIVHENTASSIGQTFKMSSKATVNYTVDTMNGEDVTRGFYSKVLLKK